MEKIGEKIFFMKSYWVTQRSVQRSNVWPRVSKSPLKTTYSTQKIFIRPQRIGIGTGRHSLPLHLLDGSLILFILEVIVWMECVWPYILFIILRVLKKLYLKMFVGQGIMIQLLPLQVKWQEQYGARRYCNGII